MMSGLVVLAASVDGNGADCLVQSKPATVKFVKLLGGAYVNGKLTLCTRGSG
jgi:hypothetical protein